MIPTIYDRQRVVRILGEDGSPQKINIDPNLPQASANTDNPAIDSIYNPTIGEYDVVCDAGPSYATKRDEAANMMLSLTQANPALFQTIGDLMMKNMDWPGAEEISKRLQALLPPQLQSSEDGTTQNPQMMQAQQMMEQMANQMEHLSQELQTAQNDKMIEIQRAEREWFDSQTKRIDVEGKLMMTDAQLQAAVQQNLMMMMGMGQQELIENNQEFEQLEESAQQPPQQQPQGQGPQGQGPGPGPQAPRGNASAGSMTRKADAAALTGEAKPGEQKQ